MEPEQEKDRDKPRILIVEDEPAIRRGLCDVLAFHGFSPAGEETGEKGLQAALDGSYDLVILDVMLPGISGFEVCARLRAERPSQTILMLTARGSEDDVVTGFERGADDYVTKPFSVSELVARVKALLRRAGSAEPPGDEGFAFGDWRIAPAALRATRGDESVELSPRELQILRIFVREMGRVVSRRMLLQEVWGFSHPENIETRTVDMQIGKLRRKVDEGERSWIETVRGAGYRYSASD